MFKMILPTKVPSDRWYQFSLPASVKKVSLLLGVILSNGHQSSVSLWSSGWDEEGSGMLRKEWLPLREDYGSPKLDEAWTRSWESWVQVLPQQACATLLLWASVSSLRKWSGEQDNHSQTIKVPDIALPASKWAPSVGVTWAAWEARSLCPSPGEGSCSRPRCEQSLPPLLTSGVRA